MSRDDTRVSLRSRDATRETSLGENLLARNYKASRIERAAFSEVQSGVRLSRALFSGTRRSRFKSARAAPNEASFLVAAREKNDGACAREDLPAATEKGGGDSRDRAKSPSEGRNEI